MTEKSEIIQLIYDNPNWDYFYEYFLKEFNRNIKAEYVSELLGYPLLGKGTSRFVLDVNGFAVKFFYDDIGSVGNDQEEYLWNTMPIDCRKYFAAFLGKTEYFSVFEKCSQMTTAEFCLYQKDIDEIFTTLCKNNISLDDLAFHTQWGINNRNNVVILDYTEYY